MKHFATHENLKILTSVVTVNTIMQNITGRVILVMFILLVYFCRVSRMHSTGKDVSTQTEEIITNNDALVDEEPEEQRHILAYILGNEN